MIESKCPAVSLCFFLSLASLPAFAQSGAKDGEWRTYGGDLGNTRYSPLDQINADELQQARSRVALQNGQPGPTARDQSGSDAADGERRGLLHGGDAARRGGAGRGHRRAAVGAQREGGTRAATSPRDNSPGRGLAYWTDGREERILYVTAGLSPDRAECQDRIAESPASEPTAWSI